MGTARELILPTVGLILAGGEGRRMNYANKGLMMLDERPLVAHVIERLSPQVDQIYISANSDLERYRTYGLPVFADEKAWQGKGPLAGIASFLDNVDQKAYVQVVSCDSPLISPMLVSHLNHELRLLFEKQEGKAVYPQTVERAHYLHLQACTEDLQIVRELLMKDDLRIRALLQKLSAKPVVFPHEKEFLNCNSPEDIQRLKEELL